MNADHDSPRLLWRGGDPAKFTALQAALRDEGVRFWDAPVYDPSGGFFTSQPYYLESAPCFEIRVHSLDLDRARKALEWVESKETVESPFGGFRAPADDPLIAKKSLPYNWDPKEATYEVWSGEDESMAEYLACAFRENGIPSHIPDDPGHRVRLCVRPEDLNHARAIARQIVEGTAST